MLYKEVKMITAALQACALCSNSVRQWHADVLQVAWILQQTTNLLLPAPGVTVCLMIIIVERTVPNAEFEVCHEPL